MNSAKINYATKDVFKRTLLVAYRKEIIPVNVQEIAFFAVEEISTMIHTKNGKKFRIHKTLEQIEKSIDPNYFFRVNRQHLVAYNAVKRIEPYNGRKLLVELSLQDAELITVSRSRANAFLQWMEIGR